MLCNPCNELDLHDFPTETIQGKLATFKPPATTDSISEGPTGEIGRSVVIRVGELLCLLVTLFAFAGDPAPMVNESHYLIKAKSFWQPDWCASDLFVSSAKAHTTFYFTFGWMTQCFSLEVTAWIGRLLGWLLIAHGLSELSWNLFRKAFLGIPIAILWMAATEYGNLAGEWVIGGIEAKVPAFGFVLWGAAEMIRRRWHRTWILLGCASAFHVLTGGWSVVAASIAWCVCERRQSPRSPLLSWPLVVGGAIALFGLVPALALQSGASAEEGIRAARIYTYYRLPHHLVPTSFQLSWYLRHGTLLASIVIIAGRFGVKPQMRPLIAFAATAFGLSVLGFAIGIAMQWAPNLAAQLLRYYWFRLADAIIPLLFSVLIVNLLLSNQRRVAIFGWSVTLLATLCLSVDAIQRSRLQIPPSASHHILGFAPDASPSDQQQSFRDWIAVCHWARRSSDPSEVFLTPRHQQTFKWYAQRAEVANWKDVPQDASSLIQWYDRFTSIYPQRLGNTRVTIQYPILRQYREQFGVRWMIVDRRIVGEHLPLNRVYPTGDQSNETYAVYELPR